jgi:carbon monoxide dehydrogenase subunit G
MLIENSFEVPAAPDVVWAYLLDVEKVAPCMPGAELTETVDDRNWKGKVNMAFGPVKMSFTGAVAMEELDETDRRVKLNAKGTEQKGKGAATASVTSWLTPTDSGGTKVDMQADITLTGAAAQLSRGLLPEISKKLTQQFADCLQANLQVAPAEAAPAEVAAPEAAAGERAPEAAPTPAPAPASVAAKPVGGIRLGLSALWAAIVGFFKKLFGGSKKA